MHNNEGHMNLNKKNKKYIDSLSYYELLRLWRFAPAGDKWFEGDTGIYWGERMSKLRSQPGGEERHVNDSKTIGWEK